MKNKNADVIFNSSHIDKILKENSTHVERKLKSISLLPPAEDAGYKQLPYEQITKDEYYDKIANIKPLNLKGNTHDIQSEDKFCDGDNCTI